MHGRPQAWEERALAPKGKLEKCYRVKKLHLRSHFERPRRDQPFAVQVEFRQIWGIEKPTLIVLRFYRIFRRSGARIVANALSKRDAFPIADIHDALNHLRGSRCFATIDLLSGYWQRGMTERADERSAFIAASGHIDVTVLQKSIGGPGWRILGPTMLSRPPSWCGGGWLPPSQEPHLRPRHCGPRTSAK